MFGWERRCYVCCVYTRLHTHTLTRRWNNNIQYQIGIRFSSISMYIYYHFCVLLRMIWVIIYGCFVFSLFFSFRLYLRVCILVEVKTVKHFTMHAHTWIYRHRKLWNRANELDQFGASYAQIRIYRLDFRVTITNFVDTLWHCLCALFQMPPFGRPRLFSAQILTIQII